MPRKRSFRWRGVVEQVAGVVILVAVGWYLWDRRDTIAEVVNVSLTVVLALAVGVLVSWIVTAAQSYLLFRAQGIGIGFGENLIVVVGTSFGNYLPMRIGTLIRIRYMKRAHGMRYARFGSMVTMRLVLMLSATGLLGLVGVVGLWATEGTGSAPLAALFLGLFAASAAAFLFRLPTAAGTGFVRRAWNDFIEGVDVTRARPAIAFQVVALLVAQYAILAWRLDVSLSAVSVESPFFLLAMLGPLTALVSTVAFTPGGIGIREAVIGYVTFEAGMTFDSGMIAGAVDRAVSLCLIVTLGSISFVYLWWGLRRREGARGNPENLASNGVDP